MTEIPDEPSDEERRILDALRAYVDSPSEETEAALLRAAPGGHGLWLRDVGEAMQDFPLAWDATRSLRLLRTHFVWFRTRHRQPLEFDEEDEAVIAAANAYIDAPGPETEAALRLAVPEEWETWYVDFMDAYRGLPRSAWGLKPRKARVRALAAPEPVVLPAPVDHRVRRRRRPARWPSLRILRPSAAKVSVTAAAAAAVIVLVGALVINPFSGQSPRHPVTGAAAVPIAWRLAGFIDQPAWQATGSPGAVGSSGAVTCPSEATCYADEPDNSPGDTVVEVTTSGGSTWQASSLPPGWQLTSALSCPTAERCLAGGDTGATIASGPPTGGMPGVLATTDGGATWSAVPVPSGVAEVTNLACGSPVDCVGTGYGPPAAGERPSAAVVTTDGGSSWTVVALPSPFVADNPEGLACPTTQQCVLVGTTGFTTPTAGSSTVRGAVLYTTDGGRGWSPAVVPATVVRIRAVSCSDTAHCMALGKGLSPGSESNPYGPSQVLTSNDGGATWLLTGPTGLVPASLVSISCPTAVDCWAAGRQLTYPSGIIAVTHDAGVTWTTVALPTTPSPAQQRATGLVQLDTRYLTSVSCPSTNACVALGIQVSLDSAQQQIVLRTDGP